MTSTQPIPPAKPVVSVDPARLVPPKPSLALRGSAPLDVMYGYYDIE